MLSEPRFVERAAEPYAAIRLTVERAEIATAAPPLVGIVLDWVNANAEQAGPAFFNYTRMDDSRMEMEVGVPTTAVPAGDGRTVGGTLPAGRYVLATYTGNYSGLHAAHEQLHVWLAAQGMKPQDIDTKRPMTLLEIYETDPGEEPDPEKWLTHIAFKLGD